MFSFFKKKPKESEWENKRDFPRLKKTFVAQLSWGGRKTFATIFNLSSRGLGLFSESSLEQGTLVDIVIQYEFMEGAYESKPINLKLQGKIMWVDEVGQAQKESPELKEMKYMAGIFLDGVTDEQSNALEAILCPNSAEESASTGESPS